MIRTHRGSSDSRGNPFSLLDRIAIVGIAAQFAVMLAISYVVWQRHALTGDFAGFYHAWSAIAHGDLNPWHQDAERLRYIQNHGEIIAWLFAPAYWLIPTPFGLRLIQDLSGAGISAVCYLWIRALLSHGQTRPGRTELAVGITAIALIVLDPWPIWSNSFDFHWQATGTLFLILAAFAFFKRRFALGLVASFFVALTGDVMATILAGLGLSMAFMRGVRLAGAAVIVLGAGAFMLIHALGGGMGYGSGGGLETLYSELFLPAHPQGVTAAALLAFVLTHPQNVLTVLAHNAKEIYANLAPAGFAGIFYPWSWGVSLVTLLENNLASRTALEPAVALGSTLPPCVLPACLERNFAQPSFQSYPLYAFVTLGTGALLVALARKVRGAGVYAACTLLALNVAGWAVVWLPRVPSRWIIVRPAAAAELTRVNASIPRNEEVVGGEAFLGLFADRPIYYSSIHPAVPIRTFPTDIVIAPYEGVNVLGANVDLSRIAALARDPHARLVSHRAGVWWFAYTPAPGTQPELTFPMGAEIIPAWTLDAITGVATLSGPVDDWRIEYVRSRGDVFQNDYWRVPVGRYNATVEIANTEPVIAEVRNASGGDLILRRELAPAPRKTYVLPFAHALAYDERGFSGWGPFQYDPTPFQDNALEVRIWSDGSGTLAVYRAGISRITESLRTIVH